MAFLLFPLTDTAEAVTARILDAMTAALPGWRPVEGAPEVALAEEIGREIADLRTLTADVSSAVVKAIGSTVLGVTPLPGVAATCTATFTLTGPGLSVPGGYQVAGRTDSGVDVALVVPATLTAAAGSSTVTATLVAASLGAGANGVPAGALTLTTASAVVVSVTSTSATSGGVDAETDADYLARLVQSQSTVSRTPVLPAQFALRARDVVGVDRALALDGYNPTTSTSGVERTVTVVPLTIAGLPVPAATATAVAALLDSLREVNFQVFTTPPTYTMVTVSFSAVAKAGANPATVQAAMIARGLELLHPSNFAGGDATPPVWTLQTSVRRNELLAALAAVEGCAYLAALTLNGASSDLTLAGVAPLPAPSSSTDATTVGVSPTTVTGTVVAA